MVQNVNFNVIIKADCTVSYQGMIKVIKKYYLKTNFIHEKINIISNESI